ncbi:hypothetical protein [Methanosarcina barkeri]|uniref:Uncharacterized protein n=2 Tax=Methanosarcina barkeri TaxID=2208 RepID=A0A0G3C8V1_METBA|nr:hypothetical protein [Methanosarcina barkeri]AKB57870.1 hypothetical protein MSBR2_1354 [Methanosarcina barkeri 227]AKJ38414.1 hypothetical protein MCM1_1364 [Methanosarcina barkeri CM1]
MSDNVFTHIIRIIWLVAVIIFFLLITLPFIAEYISGDNILNESIGPSKDLEANILLTENEKVTVVFKTEERALNSESLNLSLVDPQKKELFWEKSFTPIPSDETGTQKEAMTQQTIDFFSFTPKASGIYHIKISNADFPTDVKIVSGMITPSEQPSYIPLLLISLIVMFAGCLFKSIRMGFRRFSFSGAINFIISLSLSLITIYKIIGL